MPKVFDALEDMAPRGHRRVRPKGQWGRGGEAFREGGEGGVRVRDSHSPGVQESQEGLWGQGKNIGEREHDPPRFLRAQMGLQCKGVLRNEA